MDEIIKMFVKVYQATSVIRIMQTVDLSRRVLMRTRILLTESDPSYLNSDEKVFYDTLNVEFYLLGCMRNFNRQMLLNKCQSVLNSLHEIGQKNMFCTVTRLMWGLLNLRRKLNVISVFVKGIETKNLNIKIS